MKKQTLKQKIADAFKAEMPNLQSKIISSCKTEEQESAAEPEIPLLYSKKKRLCFKVVFKRLSAVTVCLLLFISGIALGLFMPRDDEAAAPLSAEAFVYLDVNPSIELRVDNENKIVECIAANEDAKIIAADLMLQGVDMNTALTAIVGSMYVNGYLSEESNSILISVDAKDDDKTNTFLTTITDKINTVFEKSGLECSIIAQSLTVNDELKQKAIQNGISVGKMHLVDKMICGMDDFKVEDTANLANMSIKELNLIYSTRPGKDDENDPFVKDVSSGNIGGFVNQNDALTLLLEAICVDASSVEWYQVKAKPSHHNETMQMVYNVLIRFANNSNTYEFEVDCKTGEIIKTDHNMPDINSSSNGNKSDQSYHDTQEENKEQQQNTDCNDTQNIPPIEESNDDHNGEDGEQENPPSHDEHHGDPTVDNPHQSENSDQCNTENIN